MSETFPATTISVSDKTANIVIGLTTVVVFVAVALLSRIQVPAPAGLDIHLFAKLNAAINSAVSVLLIGGLLTAKSGKWQLHRRIMLAAMVLSALFLVFVHFAPPLCRRYQVWRPRLDLTRSFL